MLNILYSSKKNDLDFIMIIYRDTDVRLCKKKTIENIPHIAHAQHNYHTSIYGIVESRKLLYCQVSS